jgi:hypothetical protein
MYYNILILCNFCEHLSTALRLDLVSGFLGRARNCVSLCAERSSFLSSSFPFNALQTEIPGFSRCLKSCSKEHDAQSGARTVRRVGVSNHQRTAAPLTVSQISRGLLAGHSDSKNGHTITSRAGNIVPLLEFLGKL